MNQQNNLWKFILVVGVLIWSAYEMYPPESRNLVTVFKEKAVQNRQDDAYKGILERLDKLEKENPGRTYGNLSEAIGTNDLTKYFPFYEVKGELNPKRAILN